MPAGTCLNIKFLYHKQYVISVIRTKILFNKFNFLRFSTEVCHKLRWLDQPWGMSEKMAMKGFESVPAPTRYSRESRPRKYVFNIKFLCSEAAFRLEHQCTNVAWCPRWIAAEEQTADHILAPCPLYYPPKGTLGLEALNDDTVDWLNRTALSICWYKIGPNEEEE